MARVTAMHSGIEAADVDCEADVGEVLVLSQIDPGDLDNLHRINTCARPLYVVIYLSPAGCNRLEILVVLLQNRSDLLYSFLRL